MIINATSDNADSQSTPIKPKRMAGTSGRIYINKRFFMDDINFRDIPI
jgi:hypothetical protein